MPAPVPPDEGARLEALKRYGVLDTPPEPEFDDLATLAGALCRTPIALIALVDEHRQFYKAVVGLDSHGTPRDEAFCAHTILSDAPFIVEANLPGKGVWFRVRMGRFPSRDAAGRYLADFKRETAIDAIVTGAN